MQQKETIVKELFESQMLIKYPSEEEEMGQLIDANIQDFHSLEEYDILQKSEVEKKASIALELAADEFQISKGIRPHADSSCSFEDLQGQY